MVNKNKVLAIGLAPLLGAVAALGLVAGPAGQNLTAPPANMQLSADWQAQPAAGDPARVAWANIKVNTDNTQEAQNEPFVAVNPNNSNHVVVGANNWQAGNGSYEVAAYVSFDGGATWASSNPYVNRHAGRMNAADPTIAFGADGAVYFAFVALSPADGAIAVSRSNDGGLTWSSQTWATPFTSAADKPALAEGNGNLYLYYQNNALYGRVSNNGGASWSSAVAIEAGGRNAAPVVDSKGNVSVFYNTANTIKVARLSGSSTRASYTVSTVANATPLQSRPTRYRAGIYPAAGVDGNGNMYVAWADGRNKGMGNDILYSRSADGSTWSAPVVLNTDGTSADQLMPALAVSKAGTVTAIWLDNRNDAANVNYDIYTATARDGVNFGANERVTSVSSNPYNDPRTQGRMIGDYFGITMGDGVAYAAWADSRNDNQDIYMAPIALNSPDN